MTDTMTRSHQSRLDISRSHALWAQVSLLTVPELNAAITDIIEANRRELVLNVNVNCMNLAYTRPWMRDLLNTAPIVFCDGAGVALALRLWGGVRVPVRITYADWIWDLAGLCSARNYSLFFLGGRPGVAEAAAAAVKEEHPNVKIVGCHHGYFEKTGRGSRQIIEEINAARPNILVLGFGMPMQEEWLAENAQAVETNVFLTGGAVFDFVSGRTPRGPRFMVDNGFEWLVRLVVEPRRLWKRYILGNPLFLWRAWRWTRRKGQGGE